MACHLSVVICTYNRVALLGSAVDSVLSQDFPDDEYELIVVDNGSTDGTRKMMESITGGRKNVRYVLEKKQGLSHARDRGWREARGEYVGYLDDDARATSGWLRIARDICLKVAPAAFGGPFYAHYTTPKPTWFRDEYGSIVQGDVARCLGPGENLLGGNFFVRRALFDLVGGFNPAYGMQGDSVGYGEEIEFIERIRNRPDDNCLYYEPRLSILHLVRTETMNTAWVFRQRFTDGRNDYRFHPLPSKPFSILGTLAQVFSYSFLIIGDLCFAFLLRNREHYPFRQNYYFEHTSPMVGVLGHRIERLRESLLDVSGAANEPDR